MQSWRKHEWLQGLTVFVGNVRPIIVKLAEQQCSFIGQVRLYVNKNTYGFVFIRRKRCLAVLCTVKLWQAGS